MLNLFPGGHFLDADFGVDDLSIHVLEHFGLLLTQLNLVLGAEVQRLLDLVVEIDVHFQNELEVIDAVMLVRYLSDVF